MLFHEIKTNFPELIGDKNKVCDWIFFHGLFGSRLDWHIIADQLLEKITTPVRFILLDLPGHGKGGVLPANLTFKLFLEQLNRYLGTLEVNQAIFVGYSMGGRIALHLATNYPQLCRFMILESASPGIDNSQQRTHREQQDRFLLKAVLEGDDSMGDLTFRFRQFLGAWYQNDLFAGIDQQAGFTKFLAQRLTNDPLALQAMINLVSPGAIPHLWHEMTNLPFSLLYLCGKNDQKYWQIGQRIKRASPQSQVVAIAGQNHNIHSVAPQAMIAAIINWELIADYLDSGRTNNK